VVKIIFIKNLNKLLIKKQNSILKNHLFFCTFLAQNNLSFSNIQFNEKMRAASTTNFTIFL
jgi:hypothetical protein